MKKILLKILDRIRMFSRIRRISVDAILPIVILPIMLCIAAINFYFMIAVCVVMPLFLGYVQWHRKLFAPRTKFFFVWILSSGIFLWCLFEMTVPLMELLPEENFIFITTVFAAAFCFYKVRILFRLCYFDWINFKWQNNELIMNFETIFCAVHRHGKKQPIIMSLRKQTISIVLCAIWIKHVC